MIFIAKLLCNFQTIAKLICLLKYIFETYFFILPSTITTQRDLEYFVLIKFLLFLKIFQFHIISEKLIFLVHFINYLAMNVSMSQLLMNITAIGLLYKQSKYS